MSRKGAATPGPPDRSHAPDETTPSLEPHARAPSTRRPARAAAVLFDMDGLLIDSEPAWYAVESALVAELGGTWGHEHQAACLGGTIDATCRYIIELTGTTRTADDLAASFIDAMAARFRERLPVRPGALELLDAVRAAGARTGLVSSSYRVLVDTVLDRLGHHCFDVSVSGDEVNRGKPDPQPYRTACERLEVDPGDVVVLEDALAGVVSAEAAGCVVVAVPSIAPIPPGPRRPVVPALTHIDPHWLLSLVSAT